MLQDGIIDATAVDTDEIPTYSATASRRRRDGDAGTASTHGWVDDLAATVLAAVFDGYTAGSIQVAEDDGEPVPLTGTGDWAPAYVGGDWAGPHVVAVRLRWGRRRHRDAGPPDASRPVPRQRPQVHRRARRRHRAGVRDGPTSASSATRSPSCSTARGWTGSVGRWLGSTAALPPYHGTLSPNGIPGWVNASTSTISLQSFQFGLTTTGTPGAGETDGCPGLGLYSYRLAPGPRN